jgi:predicted aspartyl protease
MSTEPATMNWREYAGRFSIEFEAVNYRDIMRAEEGLISPEKIRRARLSGVVDTGASRLVLPASVVGALGLPETGQVTVRLADGRREQEPVVGDAQVGILGRFGVFTAVVEPGRTDALIGANVLEELDFVPDCTAQRLVPRDPRGIFVELD